VSGEHRPKRVPVQGEPGEGEGGAEHDGFLPVASGHDAAPAVDEGRRRLATWLWRLPVLAALGGAGYGLVEVYRVHFAKLAPPTRPVFLARDAVEIAPLERFAAPWDGVAFSFAGLPCVALRLPDPIPGGVSDGTRHLAAFSRICTHLGCIVDLTAEPETIAFAFNHRTDRPQLTCSCHYSVFDPLRAGQAVSGPAVRPLPRVRLRVATVGDDARVLADGIESESAAEG
jgi:arsenite oxidase small subunit